MNSIQRPDAGEDELAQRLHTAYADLRMSTPVADSQNRAQLINRRRWSIGSAVTITVILIATLIALWPHRTPKHSPDTTKSTLTATASDPVPAQVMAAALEQRAENTVNGPIEWIQTTTHQAAALSGTGPGAPDIPIYVVQLYGHFTLTNVFKPRAGLPDPSGTVLLLFIPIPNNDRGGAGVHLSNQTSDLAAIATVHTFTLD